MITIPGKPIAKKRPRATRRGHHIVVYDCQAKEARQVQKIIRTQYNGELLGGMVGVKAVFYMPIPTSLSKKKREALIGEKHIKRPDLDNLIKFILDCLNGIVWKDDSQVAWILAEKRYGEEPCTWVEVTQPGGEA